MTFDDVYAPPAIVGFDKSDDTTGRDYVVIMENTSSASTNNEEQPTEAITPDELEKVESVDESILLSSSASQTESNHAPSSKRSSTPYREEVSEPQGTLAPVPNSSEPQGEVEEETELLCSTRVRKPPNAW